MKKVKEQQIMKEIEGIKRKPEGKVTLPFI